MLKAGRVVAVLMSLYMAFGLIWTGARDPYMGVDVELYGVGARPSTMAVSYTHLTLPTIYSV